MHFWIDKRSQACGFNGRHGVPASIASGRRNKSLVTPVHRFQSLESTSITQQFRRPCQPPMSQPRLETTISDQYNSSVSSNDPVGGAVISRPTSSPELDAPVYLDASVEGTLDTIPHAQLMKLGGLTKYGMWASFGLTTISVVATKFYVDHQGTFEILLLCTIGIISAGLLVTCALKVCKRTTPQQFINIQVPTPQETGVELEIPEMMPQREIIISPMPSSLSQQTTTEERMTVPDFEQPPPPYHIAILLPIKDSLCSDFPPPTYENAVR